MSLFTPNSLFTRIACTLAVAGLCLLQQAQSAALPVPTESDVAYGQHARQVLDFWQADASGPTPIVIYFHGGGFRKGDKKQIGRDIKIQEYLDLGISCVTANYPFSTDMDVQMICRESEKVLDYVKNKARDWNIDNRRIGVSGCSAGALIAFWIAGNRSQEISVIGTTMQPRGTEFVANLIRQKSPPTIIYQRSPETDSLHHPDNAQMIKDACDKNRVGCVVYGTGTNGFNPPPDGKDKHTIMREFYMARWGM